MRNKTPNPADMEPYRQTADDVLAALDTDGRSGLSLSQAQETAGALRQE